MGDRKGAEEGYWVKGKDAGGSGESEGVFEGLRRHLDVPPAKISLASMVGKEPWGEWNKGWAVSEELKDISGGTEKDSRPSVGRRNEWRFFGLEGVRKRQGSLYLGFWSLACARNEESEDR